MDRHLCRAKRTDNGEWVKGYYTYYPNGMGETEDTRHAIRDTSTNPGKLYFVDESTLCRCTGLKDENDKLIWENDIAYIESEKKYCVINWEVIAEEAVMCSFYNYCGSDLEIIGNIFDNPDLLQGGTE